MYSDVLTHADCTCFPLFVVVVFVLTLAYRHNAVRGHRTGFNNSGRGYCLRRKNKYQ